MGCMCVQVHICDEVYNTYNIHIYIYTSVKPRISVRGGAELSDSEFSGAGTVFSNSFFE
jgi:hypothetical protein